MGKKAKKPVATPEEVEVIKETAAGGEELIETMTAEREASEKYMAKQRDDGYCSWDEKEALLLGRPLDQISQKLKTQVFDPRLSTTVLERCARVTAQIPTGKVQNLTAANKGSNLLLNLALQKYIIPNANTQYDLLTKFRMEDMYSMVYGSFGHLVDYRIDDDYIGPDIQLIPIRLLLPQANITNINDADHVFVDSWVSVAWLESRPKSTWQNIDKLLELIGDAGGSTKGGSDQNQLSYSEKQYNDTSLTGKGKARMIHITTRYERDRWVTYAVDYKEAGILRNIKNPQNNNRIPIVMKHAFPLLDRFLGLGEFERGKTLQYATNSLINLYLEGVKMSIFPPKIINPEGVIASSIRDRAAAKWFETKPNSIRRFDMSPQGLDTFQSTYQFLLGAIMNQSGTSDTSISKGDDMTQGKTPEAIRYMMARESARDNWDRYMMEKSIEETFNIFIDLMVNRQEKPIDLYLFKHEIEQIRKVSPDVVEMLDDAFGRTTLKKETWRNGDESVKYRFFIDAGTTMKKDDAMENKAIADTMLLIMKTPVFAQQVPQGKIMIGSKVVDFGELLQRHIMTSGIQDWDKIIHDKEEAVVTDPVGVVDEEHPTEDVPPGTPQDVPPQPPVAPTEPPVVPTPPPGPTVSVADRAAVPTPVDGDLTTIKDPNIRALAEAIVSYGRGSNTNQ